LRQEPNVKRSILLVLTLAGAAWTGSAQRLNPVQWRLSTEENRVAPGARIVARMTARMEPGWHLYSLTAPKPIIPTSIEVTSPEAVKVRIFHTQAKIKFDQTFGINVETYEGETTFLIDVELPKGTAAGPATLTAQARFQTCNDTMCLPPRRVPASASIIVDPAAPMKPVVIPPGYSEFSPAAAATPPGAPVPAPVPARTSTAGSQGLGVFVLVAFGFGLAAIFTPCVFPMVPITVSFFLKKPSGARRESLVEALVFCLGIVVLFTSLGLATTAMLGPFGIVQLGSHIWVNAFIASVFVLFGLSLLGAFEITVPSSVLTRLDRASRRGGTLGTLLMGLTFSLTAFACVGPFVGTLLAASVQGGGLRPALGMLSFASGLALPFFFLALFPSYLGRLPKSGGWMERVKVVMGFIILAAALKYLSAVDQVLQWNVLSRERFLAVWIVLFALAGLYLLGFLRLPGVKPEEPVGLARLGAGAALLVFAISLLPGMFGGRLGELDAFVPPPSSGAFPAGGPAGVSESAWMKNQYPEALARARAESKLVLVSFTGYACTNCHWMKANMFTRPEIAAALKDFVLVELYTDGTDEASRQNQALQESRFATVAIPYYAVLDADEKVVAAFPGLTRNTQEFLAFLRSGTPRAVVQS
jgi:thiol:disulfide interchange protein DsbD